MKRSLHFLLVLPTLLHADAVIEIWPEGKMPGAAAAEAEAEVPRNDGFTRITNVSRPTLTLFPSARTDGTASPVIIVCPGGGYNYTVVDKEGAEIAAWLNTLGITALVLKYRSPKNREGAIQDLQRSIRLVRAKATDWMIDPERLGVMGFSAGGHLAARASSGFGSPSYAAIDGIDERSARPDFAVLVYPAYLANGAGEVAPELDLEAKIPPTLIIHTEDDKSHVAGTKVYQKALQAAGLPHELMLYPTGGHGYGLHCEGDAKTWPSDFQAWLSRN